jgi:dynein heavy chain
MCDLLGPYLGMIDFNHDDAAGSSRAAAGLCDWVRNLVEYHQVERVVRLKKLAAATAEARLEHAQAELARIETQLLEKEAGLGELLKTYSEAIGQQQKSKQQAYATQQKLQSAQALIDALSGATGRWESEAEMLNDCIVKTVGNAIIDAAFNSYYGMLNHTLRRSF